MFDTASLILVLVFVGLLLLSGKTEYLSFTTGLVVGLTLLQVYFHRFREPLVPDQAPEPLVPPIKLMSYAIQANPRKAWREYLIMTVLFVWAFFMLITQAFGPVGT